MNELSQRSGHLDNTGLMAQNLKMLFPLTNTGQSLGKKESQPGLAPLFK